MSKHTSHATRRAGAGVHAGLRGTAQPMTPAALKRLWADLNKPITNDEPST